MKQKPQYTIEIQGHCDERGTNDYNVALADRRANAAREYMVTLGIAGDAPQDRELRRRAPGLHRSQRELLVAQPSGRVPSGWTVLSLGLLCVVP